MKYFRAKIFHCITCSLLAASFFVCGNSLQTLAAESRTPATATVSNSTAQSIKKNAVAVYVELQGTDTIGSKLAYQLRERFNTSSQFLLTDKDQPKLQIIVATTPEFASRPEVGSAYSVTWLYYASTRSYSSYLTLEVGTVSGDAVEGLVDRLVEHTTGIAAKYSHLLEH